MITETKLQIALVMFLHGTTDKQREDGLRFLATGRTERQKQKEN